MTSSSQGGHRGLIQSKGCEPGQCARAEGSKVIFLSREGRDLGVAFQAPPGSQASSRGEAKDSALLSSRDAGLWEPPERSQGHSQAKDNAVCVCRGCVCVCGGEAVCGVPHNTHPVWDPRDPHSLPWPQATSCWQRHPPSWGLDVHVTASCVAAPAFQTSGASMRPCPSEPRAPPCGKIILCRAKMSPRGTPQRKG